MRSSTIAYNFIVFWIVCSICLSSVNSSEVQQTQWMTQITGFMEPISSLVDERCRNDTLEYLRAVKNASNFWALSMIDATAKFPSGILSGNIRSMGNFDQCLLVQHPAGNYQGKYCLARLTYSQLPGSNNEDLDKYVDLVTAGRRMLELGDDWVNGTHILPTYSYGKWAVCLPSTCSTNDIAILTREAIERATVDVGLEVGVYLDDDLCYSAASRSKPFTIVDYFVTTIFVGLVIFTIIGTASCQFGNVQKRSGVLVKILRAFSVVDNWKQLTNFDAPPNDSITCLEGMRTLSTAWVIMTHQTMFIGQLAYINKLESIKTHDDFVYYPMWNSYFNVDTFLLVSGLLRSYNLTKEFAQGRANLLKSSLQRYLRLTPSYLIVILFYVSYFDRLDSGPEWNLYVVRNSDACRKYWWQNLLYINNYMPHNYKCLLQSWYLSTDMQLFLLAPFFVYPLWKWKLFGRSIIAFATIVSVALPFVTTWINEFPGTYMFTFRNSLLNSYAHRIYMATHNRMSPYFVGLALGYIFQQKKNASLSKWKVAAGWIASLGVMYATLYGARNMTSFRHTFNLWESALYGGLHRFSWAVSVAWVIYACHIGYGGLVNRFLSCNTFRLLGRLSYSIYLSHLAVLLYNAAVLQAPKQLHVYITIRDFLGDFVFIFIVSLPLYMIVELPLFGVTKQLFKRK
ncbi:nose resistant to fluoxetine protein 6-like [Athalia rosae]|uniref:nose resistant to fluoxetine protein 6-like n=1 Tax=Athalia rosae TaxID=37344 RepID=UPI0020348D34|nr:nose resistant to fluoxetine protein 6-like [Athalia rosae]